MATNKRIYDLSLISSLTNGDGLLIMLDKSGRSEAGYITKDSLLTYFLTQFNSGHVISDSSTTYTQRNGLKFNATYFVLSDDSGGNKTVVALKTAEANGLATLDATGKLASGQIPDIAIAKMVVATEQTISDFATNSGSYTFEQGDFIQITDTNSSVLTYLYNGGTKTLTASYNIVNTTKVSWSNLLSIPYTVIATIQTEGTTNETDIVTPRAFWWGIARFIAKTGNIFAQIVEFTLGIKIANLQSKAVLGTDSNGNVQAATLTSNNVWIGNGSNVPTESGIISTNMTATALTTLGIAGNWSGNGHVFTGTRPSGANTIYDGMTGVDANYFYFAFSGNIYRKPFDLVATITPVIKPHTDGTTAIQIKNTSGTVLHNIDTINTKFGWGTTTSSSTYAKFNFIKDTVPANQNTMVSTMLVASDSPGTLAMVGFIGCDATATGAVFNGYKGRGTCASPTISLENDSFLAMTGYGYDTTTATDWKYGAAILFCRGSGNGSQYRVPGYIKFNTCQAANDTIYERMRISQDGLICIPGANGIDLNNSQTADTVGDIKYIADGNNFYIYRCTVANATKGSGTFKILKQEASYSIADDGTLDLQSGVSGYGEIQAGDDVAYAKFTFTSAGVVTLKDSTPNVIDSDTDVYLCIFDNGSNVRVKNRLGSTQNLRITVNYNV